MEELYVKFIIVSLASCERKRTVLEGLFIKYWKVKYYKRILQKLVYEEKKVFIVGRYGLEIKLPFTDQDVMDMELSYLELYIRKILDIYDVPECYLCQELNCIQGKFGQQKKWIFSYLFFRNGMELFMKKYNISKKDARIVLIDSGNQKIEVILQVILEYANYLTIITEREKYFENAVDIIYEETGLMVDVISKQDKKKLRGNFIINLDYNMYHLYSNTAENTYIMDLAFTNAKLEYLKKQKRNIELLYDYEILAGEQRIDQELLAEVLVRDNWKLSRFVKRSESVLSQNEINFILQEYQLNLGGLKIISL